MYKYIYMIWSDWSQALLQAGTIDTGHNKDSQIMIKSWMRSDSDMNVLLRACVCSGVLDMYIVVW